MIARRAKERILRPCDTSGGDSNAGFAHFPCRTRSQQRRRERRWPLRGYVTWLCRPNCGKREPRRAFLEPFLVVELAVRANGT